MGSNKARHIRRKRKKAPTEVGAFNFVNINANASRSRHDIGHCIKYDISIQIKYKRLIAVLRRVRHIRIESAVHLIIGRCCREKAELEDVVFRRRLYGKFNLLFIVQLTVADVLI